MFGVFQSTSDLIYSTNFQDPGFVFAPFDVNNDPIKIIGELEKTSIEAQNKEAHNSKTEFSERGRDQHLSLVEKAIEAIADNSFKKVVVSRVVEKASNKAPWEILNSLLGQYPTAFCYWWYHPSIGMWLGATPEQLVHFQEGTFHTSSLAGTLPVIENTDPNWSLKEYEEQQMVTDYIVQNLQGNTVQIETSGPLSHKAGKLWHLKTLISGQLKSINELDDVVRALHPTPAVCGQPKTLAQTFIRENEGYDREYYTGCLGELNLVNQSMRSSSNRNIENRAYRSIRKSTNLFVNLRCAQLKEKVIQIYVGGGITKNSVAENEWQETVNKSKTIGSVIAF